MCLTLWHWPHCKSRRATWHLQTACCLSLSYSIVTNWKAIPSKLIPWTTFLLEKLVVLLVEKFQFDWYGTLSFITKVTAVCLGLCITLCIVSDFWGEEFFAPCHNPQIRQLFSVKCHRLLIRYICSHPIYLDAVFSICNLEPALHCVDMRPT